MLKQFRFEGEDFPLDPTTAFYDWIYISALMEHPDFGEELVCYDGFTDIEFDPDKSRNCQASAAALYVTLARKKLLEQCRTFESFLQLLG